MLQEEAVDRAVGYLFDALREPRIDREEFPDHRHGALGPLLDEGKDGLNQFPAVNPRGGGVHARHEEGLRSVAPITGDVVADRPIREAMA